MYNSKLTVIKESRKTPRIQHIIAITLPMRVVGKISPYPTSRI